MDIIKVIMANIISSGLVLGFFIWLIKKYYARKVENIFNEREKVIDARIRTAEQYESKMVDVNLTMVSHLQEIVSRSRNVVLKIIENKNPILLKELHTNWIELTETLIKYQIFLPTSTYEQLHKLKGYMQSFTFVFGSLGSLVEKNSTVEINNTLQEVPAQGIEIMQNYKNDVEKLYHSIIDDLRKIINEKSRI